MKSDWIFWLILAVAGGVCVLVLAPVIGEELAGSESPARISMLVFSRLCHQDPARSFSVNGFFLPVCARCTGIYLGFFLGWTFWHFFPSRMRDRPIRNRALVAGLSPMVLDGLGNALGLFSSPTLLRFCTGLLFGAVAARALWPALKEAAVIIFSGEGNIDCSGYRAANMERK